MIAALKSWVFPSPVVTPARLKYLLEARWAPFKLSREFEFILWGATITITGSIQLLN